MSSAASSHLKTASLLCARHSRRLLPTAKQRPARLLSSQPNAPRELETPPHGGPSHSRAEGLSGGRGESGGGVRDVSGVSGGGGVAEVRGVSGGGVTKDEWTPDFSDTGMAYRSRTFRELLRHYFVYKLFSYESLVDSTPKLVPRSRRLLGKWLFDTLMKSTVYGQFVAGEDVPTIRPLLQRLKGLGVRSILDYAVEEDVSEEKEVVMETRHKTVGDDLPSPTDVEHHPQLSPSRTRAEAALHASARTYFFEGEEKCEENMKNFLNCINTAADSSDGDDAFAAIKVTGLGRVDFLLRLSEVVLGTQEIFMGLADGDDILQASINPESFDRGLVKMGVDLKEAETERLFKDIDADNSGELDVFEWSHHFQPGKELHKIFRTKKGSKVQPLLAMMDDDEKDQMKSVLRRAETLAQCAMDRGVRLMVDAEQTYFQPAIRHITVNCLMPTYNLARPVVYNTVQCYLKDAETSLRLDLALARKSGFCFGVKLVRGAYMEQEREKAGEKGYASPIWPGKEETDANYHRLLRWLISEVEPNRLHMMVASHNEQTVQLATRLMHEYGVDKSDGSVVFGQLLGMSDHVTFPLGQMGYLAYKYMPYGPVSDVIPYLLRRAQENRGMLAGATHERALVGTELQRRMRSKFGLSH